MKQCTTTKQGTRSLAYVEQISTLEGNKIYIDKQMKIIRGTKNCSAERIIYTNIKRHRRGQNQHILAI
jgi:hypothetical protein